MEIIGTRHGEKLFESLISREEMARAEDSKICYRIPADDRDLNYRMYFTQGENHITDLADYTSHNTERLTGPQVKSLLLSLDYMQGELRGETVALS